MLESKGILVYDKYFDRRGYRDQFSYMFDIGLKDGIWDYYNEEGKLIKKETYKDGELIKTETFD